MELKEIIKQIESSNNLQAVRFEPLFYQKLKEKKINDKAIQKIKQLHKCNTNTAYMIAAVSWGLYQIMDYNLYFYDLTEEKQYLNTYLMKQSKKKALKNSRRLKI